MAKSVEGNNERVNPAFVTDNTTGVKYELDFNRESVVYAEGRGFRLEDVGDFPASKIYDLFFYSFRMHHRNVARDKTDALIKKWGGVPESLAKRLMELYAQAQSSNVIQTDEEAKGNSEVTLEL